MSSAVAVPKETASSPQHVHSALTNSAILIGTGCVLFLAPLAFGAVQPWSIFVMELTSAALLVAWGIRQWTHGKIEIIVNALYLPMAAFLALGFLQWMTGTTAYRHVTYSHILLYVAYGVLAFLITQTFRRTSQFDWVMNAISIYGSVLACFAIVQGLAPNGKLYWIWASDQGGAIYGPYVNRNHYAGLMEMLTPFPLVLAMTGFTSGSKKIAATVIAALMAGSVFLSGSRGGMLAIVVEVIVLAVLLLRSQKGNWRQPLLLGGFLLLLVGFLVWLGGNELTRRLASLHTEAPAEISNGMRLGIDRDCLRMFLQRPLFGWGLGAFPIVYPRFRSFYSLFFVNQAHNDYLQLLVETGIAGVAVALWFLVLIVRGAAAKLKDWTQTASGTLTVAALVGCAGVCVHSFVDFNLQIPANAAWFYVLCAVAAAPALHESHRRRVLRRHHFIEPIQQDTGSKSA